MAPWLKAAMVAGGVGYLVTLAINRSLVVVRGPSMEPTLRPGDRLVTVPPARDWLRPGQVVVVEDPATPGHLVVKRITAVQDGMVEVRGDAAEHSTDSRSWGRLPLRAVRRLVIGRWPDLRTPLHRPPGAAHPGRWATTRSSGSSSATSPSPRAP